MAVTMRDVAELAKVSVKSVSNVVSGYEHVSPQLRSRVEQALETLGYQLNVSARNLRTQRTGMITLAIPELALPYFAELAASVIKVAESQDWTVVIEQTGSERSRELDVLSGRRMRVSDGVLFAPSELWTSSGESSKRGFPLVVLGEQMQDVPADYVTMDNVDASKGATAHLIGLGRRRIVALGGHTSPIASTAARRHAGYAEALREAGLDEDPRLVVPVIPWHRQAGAAAMAHLLDSGVPFDAVFAFNDTLALGALHVLHQRGVRVPGDVAVIGFDDIDDVRYSLPTVSSIDPRKDMLAEVAVRRLLARIAGEIEGFQRVTTEWRIVGRQSTGDTLLPGDERTISVQPGSPVPQQQDDLKP